MVCQNCSRGFTSVKAWEYHDCKPPSLPPSYTLEEIEALAREYVDEAVNRTTDQLVLSLFVQWLARKEREGRG